MEDTENQYDGLDLDEEELAMMGEQGAAVAPVSAPGDVPDDFRSGFVALVGRPNAGKSTLLNACMGGHVAITSPVAQTTRKRMRAVINRPDAQIVIVDTPGLHKPKDTLGRELNRAALAELADVDVVAMLLDATKPAGTGDAWVAKHVDESRAVRLLVVTKADIATPEQVQAQLEAGNAMACFDESLVVSSTEDFNVDSFIAAVTDHLPYGPRWFPLDMPVDASDEELAAEFIREKILRTFRDEVPHSIGVAVEQMEYVRKKDLMRIWAVIYVERESQKGILIGHRGAAIRQIGTEARADLEQLLGCRVFLDLSVKCKKNWRRDANQIRRFGYGE